ncbi:tyrosine-type recombinase/integrase [Halorhabdus salina]|uniref:tyrosine-type recombinase/integrase n=1 Tax=Halorhabdus salina TaxID=2750670 RepID=UPI0015EF44A0|nr:tyrosine-type recombinase/integrase [Halorhabdus salina]
MSELQPLGPQEAVELYLDSRESELSEKSLENQKYRLRSFVEWCKSEDIGNLNDLTGRDLHQFRVWRANGNSDRYEAVSTVTLVGILQTLRKFLEFCASIDAVEQGLRERVLIPEVDPEDETSDEKLSTDQAKDLLRYLDRFQYASRDHVIIAILWHTGIRLGSLRAFDLEDFDPEGRYLQLRHRPDDSTPLKNGTAAERKIAVGEHYVQVISDYIRHHRHDVVDSAGREPLITSRQGRLTEVPIRQTLYRWTRPCMISDCPHDKHPESCDWMRDNAKASRCPSSQSPHSVRRGAITQHLRDGVPEEIVTDRMNVSSDVLDQHYDQRSERERMETRREFLDN